VIPVKLISGLSRHQPILRPGSVLLTWAAQAASHEFPSSLKKTKTQRAWKINRFRIGTTCANNLTGNTLTRLSIRGLPLNLACMIWKISEYVLCRVAFTFKARLREIFSNLWGSFICIQKWRRVYAWNVFYEGTSVIIRFEIFLWLSRETDPRPSLCILLSLLVLIKFTICIFKSS